MSILRGKAKPRSDGRSARINLDLFSPSLELLNGCDVFQGRIRFQAVKKRGSVLIATTDKSIDVVFDSAKDLSTFSKAREVLADATNIFLDTPPQNEIRAYWEPAARLFLRLAAADAVIVENAQRLDTRELLRLMWRQSGQKTAIDSGEFIDFMRKIMTSRRDPRPEASPPPSVFIAEQHTWVHVPTWRIWLSTPKFMNKLYELSYLRNGLLLLDFTYEENLTRGFEGDSESLCLWLGPLKVLENQ